MSKKVCFAGVVLTAFALGTVPASADGIVGGWHTNVNGYSTVMDIKSIGGGYVQGRMTSTSPKHEVRGSNFKAAGGPDGFSIHFPNGNAYQLALTGEKITGSFTWTAKGGGSTSVTFQRQ